MIAVCGPNNPTSDEDKLAEQIGILLAKAGRTVVCGGRDGVMAAVCRGAKQAGGVTIGILPGYDRAEANQWVDHVIPTGMGHARNAIVVASGEAVIAVGGGFGTLSEIGLALKMGKRVIAVGSWELESARLHRFLQDGGEFLLAETAEEAVRLALDSQQPQDRRPEFQPSGHG